jgi:hypothetical protein
MSVNPAKCRTIVTAVVAGRTVPRTKRSTYRDGDVSPPPFSPHRFASGADSPPTVSPTNDAVYFYILTY